MAVLVRTLSSLRSISFITIATLVLLYIQVCFLNPPAHAREAERINLGQKSTFTIRNSNIWHCVWINTQNKYFNHMSYICHSVPRHLHRWMEEKVIRSQRTSERGNCQAASSSVSHSTWVQNHHSLSNPPAGVRKGGTRALLEMLSLHPVVRMAPQVLGTFCFSILYFNSLVVRRLGNQTEI